MLWEQQQKQQQDGVKLEVKATVVAAKLGQHVMTVLGALWELEAVGLIDSRIEQGVFIVSNKDKGTLMRGDIELLF